MTGVRNKKMANEHKRYDQIGMLIVEDEVIEDYKRGNSQLLQEPSFRNN